MRCAATIAQLRREVDKLSYLAEEQAKIHDEVGAITHESRHCAILT